MARAISTSDRHRHVLAPQPLDQHLELVLDPFGLTPLQIAVLDEEPGRDLPSLLS
jgi:hypothetical protein